MPRMSPNSPSHVRVRGPRRRTVREPIMSPNSPSSAGPRPVAVLGAGMHVVDILARLPEQVRTGDKHQIRDLVIQGGGPVSNAVCVTAALGWPTGFLGRLGDNTLSTIARAEFTRYGVIEDFFIHDPLACPGVSIVQIDPQTAERTCFYSLNNYGHLQAADIPADVVRQTRVILVDGYETDTALWMLQAAAGSPCRSIADVETGDPAILCRIISMATDPILPLAAAQKLTGLSDPADVLDALVKWTAGQIIVTDGDRGSWAATPTGVHHQPAFRVAVVDTTGCGDAYHGAYAAALLDNLTLPLRMEFAAWIAAQVATHLGARGDLPTRASIRAADLSALSPPLRQHLQN